MKIINAVILAFSVSAFAKGGGAENMHATSNPIPVELAVVGKPALEQNTIDFNGQGKVFKVFLPWVELSPLATSHFNVSEVQKPIVLMCMKDNFSSAFNAYVDLLTKNRVSIDVSTETAIDGNELRWKVYAQYADGGLFKSKSVARLAGRISFGEVRKASKLTFWNSNTKMQSPWYMTETLEADGAKGGRDWLDITKLEVFKRHLSLACMTPENINGKTLTGEILLLEPEAPVRQVRFNTSKNNLSATQSCLKGERVWFGIINSNYEVEGKFRRVIVVGDINRFGETSIIYMGASDDTELGRKVNTCLKQSPY